MHVLHMITTYADITEKESPNTELDNMESRRSDTPRFCLKLPGRKLDLFALLYAKRFRDHGYKKGALAAFQELEKKGLGNIQCKTGNASESYYVHVQ